MTGGRPIDGGQRGFMTDTSGFDELVRRAQAGDREAMDEVLAILRPQIEPLARRYADPARPVGSTGDLLQDSCLRAWTKLGTFRGGGNDEETFAMFRAWMGQIVRRLGMKAERDRHVKRRSPSKPVVRLSPKRPGASTSAGGGIDAPGREPRPSSYVRLDERTRRVEEALQRLSDDTDVEIVRMHFFDELSLPQIAERLEIDFKEVRRRYRAAMRILEHDLREWL